MKLYSRIIFIISAFILTISLCGCIAVPISKHYSYSSDEIDSIQFYDLRSSESEIYPGFDKSIKPAYTLPQEDIDDFLIDFSNLEFSDSFFIVLAAVDPSFSYGDWVIRINFTNNQYTFYSCDGYGETFDDKGNCISSTHFSCSDEDLDSLVNKYFKTTQAE